ncbi:MAG: hypothetical protein ACREQL_08895, partial [Candidatus Binatia bacterium]
MALEPSSPEAVFDFLETNVSPRGRAHWQWKYRLDGSSPGRAFYHVASDGTVGGFVGLLPTTLHGGDGTARAAWFVDWATLPGEASVGAGVGLLRRAEAATDVLLTLQGSADTQKILPKLRWHSVDTPATWVLRLSARSVVERGPVRGRPWLRAPALVLGAIARLRYRIAKPAAAGCALAEVERFPASYDAVWTERRSAFAPLMERTSTQLNFMCADYPGGGYRRFLVLAGSEIVGHLVLRVDRKGTMVRGRIIDALWDRDRRGMIDWLVRTACWMLQECGVDYI